MIRWFAAIALVASGCTSSEVRESVREWRVQWNLYKRATIADPRYGVDGIAAVASLRGALDRHLDVTEELTGVHPR